MSTVRTKRAWSKLMCAATVAAGVSVVTTPARASGFDACFKEAQAFAMCNGIFAGLAGAGAVVAPTLAIHEPDDSSSASVAAGVGLGLYAAVSGAALLASSQAQEPGATLRDSGTVVGIVDLTLGGSALVLSAFAGVAIALNDGGDEANDEVDISLNFGVPSAGASPGITLTAQF